jgi:C-terminal processing protease CtpA/Prc
MVPNGSAERDGRIREDDELVGINSISVDHQTTLEELRSLILGPTGTFVMLSLRRPSGMNGDRVREDYWYFDVELQRGNGQDAPGGGD